MSEILILSSPDLKSGCGESVLFFVKISDFSASEIRGASIGRLPC